MRSDMTAPDFKIRDKVERQKLHNVMKEAYTEVLLNFGDRLMNKNIILLIIEHFKGDVTDDVVCFIPRKFTTEKRRKARVEGANVCIEAYLNIIPRSLAKHRGGESLVPTNCIHTKNARSCLA
jgi:hypothetical protein